MQIELKGKMENINDSLFKLLPDEIIVEKTNRYTNIGASHSGEDLIVKGEMKYSQKYKTITIKPTEIYSKL